MNLLAFALLAGLAPTPPTGWNSRDCCGTGVTEDEVKANAGYMSKNLKAHSWQYMVVDIQWSEPNPKTHGYRLNTELAMDRYGRLMPAVNRLPSSADGKGFKPLADYVHSKGMKFGIHLMRGIPRALPWKRICPFSTASTGRRMSRSKSQSAAGIQNCMTPGASTS